MAKRRRVKANPGDELKHVPPDRFAVLGDTPRGWSYQWMALDVLGESQDETIRHMRAVGWKEVPTKRHPAMPSDGRRIVVGGQVLMQRRTTDVDSSRAKEIDAALAMFNDHPGSGGSSRQSPNIVNDWGLGNDGGCLIYEGSAIDVQTTITVRLSPNLVQAALVCHLEPEEYARRMIIMMQDGRLSGILAPDSDRKAFCVCDLSIKERYAS